MLICNALFSCWRRACVCLSTVRRSNTLNIAVNHRLICCRATFRCRQICWLLVSLILVVAVFQWVYRAIGVCWQARSTYGVSTASRCFVWWPRRGFVDQSVRHVKRRRASHSQYTMHITSNTSITRRLFSIFSPRSKSRTLCHHTLLVTNL